jgi:hypothetical protein
VGPSLRPERSSFPLRKKAAFGSNEPSALSDVPPDSPLSTHGVCANLNTERNLSDFLSAESGASFHVERNSVNADKSTIIVGFPWRIVVLVKLVRRVERSRLSTHIVSRIFCGYLGL